MEEIKCALCSLVYNESERMPILLPDCGHSFCQACIQDYFELLTQESADNNEETKNESPEDFRRNLFRCPEDE